jgi:hypothetical protein
LTRAPPGRQLDKPGQPGWTGRAGLAGTRRRIRSNDGWVGRRVDGGRGAAAALSVIAPSALWVPADSDLSPLRDQADSDMGPREGREGLGREGAGPGVGEGLQGGRELGVGAHAGAAVCVVLEEDVGIAGGEGGGLGGVGEVQPASLPAGWERLLASGALRLARDYWSQIDVLTKESPARCAWPAPGLLGSMLSDRLSVKS